MTNSNPHQGQPRSHPTYVGSHPKTKTAGRDSNAWYTPKMYIESARTVRAGRYFNEQQDALKQDWAPTGAVRVWMNPPYSATPFRSAVLRLVAEVDAGRVSSAILLCNNCTETRAVQAALRSADAVCLTDHRISFIRSGGDTMTGNPRGQLLAYWGPDAAAFRNEFSRYGVVLGA